MPIKRVDLVVAVTGADQSGKSTMLDTISRYLKVLGYQIQDEHADKEHKIVASYPIVQTVVTAETATTVPPEIKKAAVGK